MNDDRGKDGGREQRPRSQNGDGQMPAKSCQSDRVLPQSLAPAPSQHEARATGNESHGRQGKKQLRCSCLRDVRGGPLENRPTGPRRLKLTRLELVQRGGCEQQRGRQNEQPFRDSEDRQLGRACGMTHVNLHEVLCMAKLIRCQSKFVVLRITLCYSDGIY